MALKDFEEEVFIRKKNLHVVLCIYQQPEFFKESPINEMLESVERELKKQFSKYNEIYVAYVYETPTLEVKSFEKISEHTSLYYKDLYQGVPHKLSHVYFMGMIMLQRQFEKYGDDEYQLYLITDDKFSNKMVNSIVYKEEDEVYLLHCFVKKAFQTVLIRPIKENETYKPQDNLERFIMQHGKVLLYDKQQKVFC